MTTKTFKSPCQATFPFPLAYFIKANIITLQIYILPFYFVAAINLEVSVPSGYITMRISLFVVYNCMVTALASPLCWLMRLENFILAAILLV